MNIEENNKLIAEFMGLKECPIFKKIDAERLAEGRSSAGSPMYIINKGHTSNLRYDFSWDWLMPVVERIDGNEDFYINHSSYFNKRHVHIKIENNRRFKEISIYYGNNKKVKTRLEATYLFVVEFIKWYNQNK